MPQPQENQTKVSRVRWPSCRARVLRSHSHPGSSTYPGERTLHHIAPSTVVCHPRARCHLQLQVLLDTQAQGLLLQRQDPSFSCPKACRLPCSHSHTLPPTHQSSTLVQSSLQSLLVFPSLFILPGGIATAASEASPSRWCQPCLKLSNTVATF